MQVLEVFPLDDHLVRMAMPLLHPSKRTTIPSTRTTIPMVYLSYCFGESRRYDQFSKCRHVITYLKIELKEQRVTNVHIVSITVVE
jgi:hypothetical protein